MKKNDFTFEPDKQRDIPVVTRKKEEPWWCDFKVNAGSLFYVQGHRFIWEIFFREKEDRSQFKDRVR